MSSRTGHVQIVRRSLSLSDVAGKVASPTSDDVESSDPNKDDDSCTTDPTPAD